MSWRNRYLEQASSARKNAKYYFKLAEKADSEFIKDERIKIANFYLDVADVYENLAEDDLALVEEDLKIAEKGFEVGAETWPEP